MSNWLLVQFEKTVQVSEDSWRVTRPSIRVHFSSNLQAVLKWVMETNDGKMPEKMEVREINDIQDL